MSIKTISTSYKPGWRMSWTENDEAPEGYFRFVVDEERGCVQTNRDCGRQIKGTFLDKIYVDNYQDNKTTIREGFYPVLHKMLKERLNWGTDFLFRGVASFMPCLMEWTEDTLAHYGDTLRRADIHGLVGASCFPYMVNSNIWRAFCELWGPLTNTLHLGGGELGISLHDLKQIAGLPILGEPYEEFLPPNELLSKGDRFPPTVLELLRVHAMLLKHLGRDKIYWEDWLEHFYRGEQRFVAYGEPSDVGVGGRSLNTPKSCSSKDSMKEKKLLNLNVSREGKLAAFLSLLLCRFVFSHGPPIIRPGTFVMACLIANGRKISLAPTILGHIYRGLNQMATHPTHPGRADPSFGIHFVIGWIAEYFPCVYRRRPADEFPADYPLLVRYAGLNGVGLNGKPHTIHQARLILRHSKYIDYCAIPFGDDVDIYKVDAADASDVDFECLLCIRSCVLPIRVGGILAMEPYYPNRFSRQFGFDQGIPSNSLHFSLELRSHRSLNDIAHCYAWFFSRNTGVGYYIPPSGHMGICTVNYYRWWVSVSAPYLSQSINKFNITMTRKESQLRDNIFIITDMPRVISGLRGAVRVPNVGSPSSSESPSPLASFPPTNKRVSMESSPSDDVHFKRRKKSSKSNESDSEIQEVDNLNFISTHDPIPHVDSVEEPQGDSVPMSLDIQPSETIQEVARVASYEVISPSLHDLFSSPVNDYVRQAVVASMKEIVEAISKAQSAQILSSLKDEISGDLETLNIIARAAKVDESVLSWVMSQFHKFLEEACTVSELADVVDVVSLSLPAEVSLCETEISSMEEKLLQLNKDSLDIKEEEKEVLNLRGQLQQKEQDLAAAKKLLEKNTCDLELFIRSQKEKKNCLEELQRTTKTQFEELLLKKELIKGIVESLTSFVSID